MKAVLTKRFTFEAAHFLPYVAPDHKCRRIHGHSFICEIEVCGPIDEQAGWVMDFGEIKKRIAPVRNQLDHRFLNQDIPGLENATSENICRWIWQQLKPSLPILSAVTIAETCTSKCSYRGED